MKRASRFLMSSACVCVCLASLSALRDQGTPPLSAPPGIERMVDVGGRRLHTRVYGAGAPAVVLLSGSRAPQSYWDPVVPAVAEKTTVVTYDRAGYGKSEMGALGCDGVQSMKDLKALLDSSRVPGPWLIVGHSLGGRLARLFAFLYPGNVAGLVLIDTGLWDPRRPIPPPTGGEGTAGQRPAEKLVAPVVAQTESECNDWTWRQVEAITSYPRVPLTVITAGIPQLPPGLDAEARRKAEERRRLDQEALARIIPEGRHITLPGIGHDVIHQAPEAVVSAILDMLGRIALPSPLSAQPCEAPSGKAMKLDKRLSVDAAALGKKIYAIGGRGKDERHDRHTYVYSTTTDSWKVKKGPMFPRSNHAVAALGDKIYVLVPRGDYRYKRENRG